MTTKWKPDPKASDLGSILIKMGAATSEQVAQAALAQKLEVGKLGQLMMRMGFINQSQLETALAFQIRMRAGDAVEVMVEIVRKKVELEMLLAS